MSLFILLYQNTCYIASLAALFGINSYNIYICVKILKKQIEKLKIDRYKSDQNVAIRAYLIIKLFIFQYNIIILIIVYQNLQYISMATPLKKKKLNDGRTSPVFGSNSGNIDEIRSILDTRQQLPGYQSLQNIFNRHHCCCYYCQDQQ